MTEPPRLLIGVDVGTTHVKAVLLEPGRGILHVARRRTPVRRAPGGGATHGPDALVAAALEVVAECSAAAVSSGSRHATAGDEGRRESSVAAIGIASMAEAGVPLDRAGQPLGDVVAWFDPRPAAQAAAIESAVGAAELFARTGLRADAKYSLAKLAWWREHRPSTFRRTWQWAGVAELVAYALTAGAGVGRAVGGRARLTTNASLACRTLAFDVVRRDWDRELLALAGLDVEQMPEVVPLGRSGGGLAKEVADRAGLEPGIPVAVAGHDHLVGALGAAIARPGDGLDSMGSAEVALLVTGTPSPTEAVRQLGFSTGCHAADGLGYVLGGLQTSGSLVEWWLETSRGDAGGESPGRDDPERYAAFLAALESATARPGEILVRPYLRGRTAPFPDPAATLEIAGLHASHHAGDIGAAILDAAAFHVRWMFEQLEAATATGLTSVRAIGGGTRNPRWLAAKAALGPWPFDVARTDEAAAHGAALVGGLAAGLYPSLDAALVDAAPADRVPLPVDGGAAYRAAYTMRWLPWIEATLPGPSPT